MTDDKNKYFWQMAHIDINNHIYIYIYKNTVNI